MTLSIRTTANRASNVQCPRGTLLIGCALVAVCMTAIEGCSQRDGVDSQAHMQDTGVGASGQPAVPEPNSLAQVRTIDKVSYLALADVAIHSKDANTRDQAIADVLGIKKDLLKELMLSPAFDGNRCPATITLEDLILNFNRNTCISTTTNLLALEEAGFEPNAQFTLPEARMSAGEMLCHMVMQSKGAIGVYCENICEMRLNVSTFEDVMARREWFELQESHIQRSKSAHNNSVWSRLQKEMIGHAEDDITIRQMLERISQAVDLPIIYDANELEEMNVGLDCPMNTLWRSSAAEAISNALLWLSTSNYDFDYTVENNRIVLFARRPVSPSTQKSR